MIIQDIREILQSNVNILIEETPGVSWEIQETDMFFHLRFTIPGNWSPSQLAFVKSQLTDYCHFMSTDILDLAYIKSQPQPNTLQFSFSKSAERWMIPFLKTPYEV